MLIGFSLAMQQSLPIWINCSLQNTKYPPSSATLSRTGTKSNVFGIDAAAVKEAVAAAAVAECSDDLACVIDAVGNGPGAARDVDTDP